MHWDAQIAWSTVFFWEYFGPLIVYAFIYAFPQLVYPSYKYDCEVFQALLS